LEDNSRQKQFEKIVLQIKEHMEHPTLSLYITQKDNLIDVRQFHRRGDGNIGYGLYPYAEDEKGICNLLKLKEIEALDVGHRFQCFLCDTIRERVEVGN